LRVIIFLTCPMSLASIAYLSCPISSNDST